MSRGMISTPPVQHWGTFVIGRGPTEEFHHRLDAGTAPGAYECGLCGRIVVRGMGAWWESGATVRCWMPGCTALSQDMAAHLADYHSEGVTDWSAFARSITGPDHKLTQAIRSAPFREMGR